MIRIVAPEDVLNVASEFIEYADEIDKLVEKLVKSDYFKLKFEEELSSLVGMAESRKIYNKPMEITNELKGQSIQIRKWAEVMNEIGHAATSPEICFSDNLFEL